MLCNIFSFEICQLSDRVLLFDNYQYTNEKVMFIDIPVYFWNSFVFSVLFFSIILIPRFKKKIF